MGPLDPFFLLLPQRGATMQPSTVMATTFSGPQSSAGGWLVSAMAGQNWVEFMRYIVQSYKQEQLQDLLNGRVRQFLNEHQRRVLRVFWAVG